MRERDTWVVRWTAVVTCLGEEGNLSKNGRLGDKDDGLRYLGSEFEMITDGYGDFAEVYDGTDTKELEEMFVEIHVQR